MECPCSNNRKGYIRIGQEKLINKICKFLSKTIVAIIIALCVTSSFAATDSIGGNIGDYGSWATEENRNIIVTKLVGEKGEDGDLVAFQSEFQKQIVGDYVPVEARIGIAMMNGLNQIAKILDTSLVRFMIIFTIIMYVFWIMLEAYNMMTTDSNVEKLAKELVKKTLILIVWITVLEIGPAQLFMGIVAPIISLGTYIANFILNAITSVAGINIPNTCAAIHEFATGTVPADTVINADVAAKILCVPTRLSGFFVTAIAMGWKWMIAGIGHSTLMFIMGAVFIAVFAWNTWKFTMMALSVIMSLFLAVLLLPFTAFAETIPQTSYKGIVGNIFNSFTALFNAKQFKLEALVNKFISAAIYFVSLSIVIAICAALLSSVINVNVTTLLPTITNEDFIPALLAGLLTAWLAGRADEIARKIGGSLTTSDKNDPGTKFTKDVKSFIKGAYESAQSWSKAFGESKS